MAMARTNDPARDVEFRDVQGEDGRDRSHLRVQTSDEVVEVEIERPRPPEPPPVPEPPRRGLRIVIEGGASGSLFSPNWHGSFDLEIGELDDVFDEMFDMGPFWRSSFEQDGWWAARAQARHAREQARHARDRARQARDEARRARDEARRRPDDARRAPRAPAGDGLLSL